MKQTDKKLLFIDLCARVPYYPYALFDSDKKFDGGLLAPIIGMVNKGNTGVIKYNQMFYAYGCMTPFSIDEFRIYLRPMSSMTEDERKEVENLIKENRPNPYGIINNKGIDNLLFSVSVTSGVLIDWLNAHYFDYRGLIEKGLALEAPADMYKID